jgi:CubicO group peptidase (beta-lactamase class C family)
MPTSTSTRPYAIKTAFGPGGAARWVLAAVASLLLVAVAGSPAAAVPPDRATLARMDGVIRDGMDGSGVPGFAVAVVSGNDVVHARGFGDAGVKSRDVV